MRVYKVQLIMNNNHLKIKDIKLNFEKLIPIIGKAHYSLSNYNGALQHLINPNILLAPMRTKESTMSSRIEGTQATLTEVLKKEAGETYKENKEEDIQEIINYKNAMYFAEKLLSEKPFIHLNMIKKIHCVLLDGVRGNNKACGEFRRVQNWIGAKNSTIETASFIPPAPNEIMDYLDEWEKFVNSDDYTDILIQLAIVHAQFEIIHPFLDGNGRLGRILIPIFLYSKKYLSAPVFYLSEYFEKNRSVYYSHLKLITQENDWQSWVTFFLNAIIEQSNTNMLKIQEILVLYDNMKNIVLETTKSQYTSSIIDTIFSRPIFTTSLFYKEANISNKNTAHSILQKLSDKKILTVIREAKGNRPAMYAFQDLIKIIDSDEI